MSEILSEVLEANRRYAAAFGDKGKLAMPPARHFAILTCMDARLDPAKFAGLSEGDAHVIRNAGGRASDDAIRSLVISEKLLGTKEWFVIHHTNCGMEFFTNDKMRELLEQSIGPAELAGGEWKNKGGGPGSHTGDYIELAEIQRLIASYLEILGSDKVLRNVIVKELKEVQKDFGDARRTQIVEDEGDFNIEDLIKVEDVVVTVSRGGYLKRTSLDTYRRQSRGGKGRIGMATRSEDVVEHLMVVNTHSYLLIFTSMGRLYWLKVYNIPDAQAAGKGKNINGLISLQQDETVRAFLAVKDFTPDTYVVMATKQGVIKKCQLDVFDNPMARGIIAIGLKEGDELIEAMLSTGKDLVFLGTREGLAIKFSEEDVRPMGRPAAGVTSMKFKIKGDYIVGMQIVSEDDNILSVAEKGFGKRTKVSEYRFQSRAGSGVINMKVNNKTGKVLAVLAVKDDTDVIFITRDGKILRTDAESIRKTGRSASGVKLVTMEPDDAVAAACTVVEAENGDEPGEQGDLPL